MWVGRCVFALTNSAAEEPGQGIFYKNKSTALPFSSTLVKYINLQKSISLRQKSEVLQQKSPSINPAYIMFRKSNDRSFLLWDKRVGISKFQKVHNLDIEQKNWYPK